MAGENSPLHAAALALALVVLPCCLLAQVAWAADGDYPVLPGSGYPLPALQPSAQSAAPGMGGRTGRSTTSPTSAGPSGPGTGSETGFPADTAPAAGNLVDTAHQIVPDTGLDITPGWTVSPLLSISEAFNDNIFQRKNHRQSDFITYITPSLTILGNTPRVQTRIAYSPTAEIFASHSSQNAVAQNLSAYGFATLIDDTLFVDVRGFGGLTPTSGGIPVGTGGLSTPSFGGFGSSSSTSSLLTTGNQTQSYSGSVSPYVVHRFGDVGTMTVAYRLSASAYNGLSSTSTVLPVAGSQTNSHLVTNEELLQFITGPALGRIRNTTLVDASQMSGNGVTNGATQTFVTNRLGYVINRVVFVFGELGWEDIEYSRAIPPVKIDDATWGFGTTLTPDPDSSITVGYGRKYGFNSAFLDGRYMLTARTQIFGRYQTGLGTDLQQLQSLVTLSGVDQYGNSIDSQTGAPLFFGNSGLGIQGNGTLNKTETYSAGLTTSLDRDTISFALSGSHQTVIANSLGSLGSGPSDAVSGSISWQHQISDNSLTSLYFGYGQQTQSYFVPGGSNVNSTFFGTLASYRHFFTSTLSGFAQYGYVERSSKLVTQEFNQNVFLIGLAKQF